MILMPVSSWSAFKTLVSDKDLRPQYSEFSGRYELYAEESSFVWNMVILNPSDDATDFETNHKSNYNKKLISRDADDVQMTRVKMAADGAKFCFHGFSFETSTLASVLETKADGTSFSYASIKLYDADDVEITAVENEDDCVKTVISFEPTSRNYEIIGGCLYQGTPPLTPITAWAVGAPTVAEQYGGSIPFLTNARCDLAPLGLAFRMDGRVPKYMRYDATYHTSRFDFIFKHNAGVKHTFSVMLELFWP